jgi:hypothetical protein
MSERVEEIKGEVIDGKLHVDHWPSGLRNSNPNMLTELWAEYTSAPPSKREPNP